MKENLIAFVSDMGLVERVNRGRSPVNRSVVWHFAIHEIRVTRLDRNFGKRFAHSSLILSIGNIYVSKRVMFAHWLASLIGILLIGN